MYDNWELERGPTIQEDKWWEKMIWWYSIGIAAGFILGTLIIGPMFTTMINL
jgi:hypothetical protein